MITNPVKRGDIVLVNFGDQSGSIQSGFCPAVVLQRDKFNKSCETTIVAPITSVIKRIGNATHIVIGKRFGLQEVSMILLEESRIVAQDAIDSCIGHIKDFDLIRRINEGLCKAFALNDNAPEATEILKRCKTREKAATKKKKRKKKPVFNQRDIMCLCPVCRNSYLHRGFRVINAGGTRDICDLCNYRTGTDYAVVGLLSR